MKRNNKTNLKYMTWANLVVLTISMAAQSFPMKAFAEDHSGPTHPAPGGNAGGPNGGHGGHGPGNGGGHGPGQNPNQPAPAPAPAPSTAPATGPAPAPAPDTASARAAGRADGAPDGNHEGNERGAPEGQRVGQLEGYRQGFDRCDREAAEHAHDQGFESGYRKGSLAGSREGGDAGDRDGGIRGLNEGQADGTRRADIDSNNAATPAGRAKGIDQANSSDATDRGRRDGTARGDADALAQAQASDYTRGRKDYNDAQYAQTPQSHGDVFQKPAPAASPLALNQELSVSAASQGLAEMRAAAPAPSAGPDYRYLNLRRNYPTPEENQAYSAGSREGYAQGFQSGYSTSYNMGYQTAFNFARDKGCEEGRRRDHRADYDRGEREGRDRGYRESYDREYRRAADFAYNREFPTASRKAYDANYDGFYNRHFEEARSAAYAARVDQLYGAAFDQARSDKYNEMYPKYAVSEYARGQKDEAQDFAQRPVRITGIEATETIANNVFEPGEALRVHVQLRNFAATVLRAEDLAVQIKARNTDLSIVTIKQETLAKALSAKSVTEIREALEFKANELAAGRSIKFDVAVSYQGRVIDTTTLEVRPNFMTQVELAETPSFKEGIAMPIRVKVTNSGNKTANGVVLNLKTNADQLEVAQPVINVGSLAAGESRVVEYSAIGRNVSESSSIPLGLVATESGSVTGRRIGLLDLSRQFPVVNDYFIDLANNAVATLRTPGVVRVTYTVKNRSSRIMFNSLQLKVRFLNTEDPTNFVVIGPNPQFLLPMDQGETVTFTVPVLVKAANKGGVIEAEVQEGGKTVVIHREDFSQAQTLN